MPGEIMSLVTKFNLDDRPAPIFGDGSSSSRVDVSTDRSMVATVGAET